MWLALFLLCVVPLIGFYTEGDPENDDQLLLQLRAARAGPRDSSDQLTDGFQPDDFQELTAEEKTLRIMNMANSQIEANMAYIFPVLEPTIAQTAKKVHDCFSEERLRLFKQQLLKAWIDGGSSVVDSVTDVISTIPGVGAMFGAWGEAAGLMLDFVSSGADIKIANDNAAADNCMKMGFDAVNANQEQILAQIADEGNKTRSGITGEGIATRDQLKNNTAEVLLAMRTGFNETAAALDRISTQSKESHEIVMRDLTKLDGELEKLSDEQQRTLLQIRQLSGQVAEMEGTLMQAVVQRQSVQLISSMRIVLGAAEDIQAARAMMSRGRAEALRLTPSIASVADETVKLQIHSALQASFSRARDAYATIATIVTDSDLLYSVAKAGFQSAAQHALQTLVAEDGYCSDVVFTSAAATGENLEHPWKVDEITAAMSEWWKSSRLLPSLSAISGTVFEAYLDVSATFGSEAFPMESFVHNLQALPLSLARFSSWATDMRQVYVDAVEPLLPINCPISTKCQELAAIKYPTEDHGVQITKGLIGFSLYSDTPRLYLCDELIDTRTTPDVYKHGKKYMFWGPPDRMHTALFRDMLSHWKQSVKCGFDDFWERKLRTNAWFLGRDNYDDMPTRSLTFTCPKRFTSANGWNGEVTVRCHSCDHISKWTRWYCKTRFPEKRYSYVTSDLSISWMNEDQPLGHRSCKPVFKSGDTVLDEWSMENAQDPGFVEHGLAEYYLALGPVFPEGYFNNHEDWSYMTQALTSSVLVSRALAQAASVIMTPPTFTLGGTNMDYPGHGCLTGDIDETHVDETPDELSLDACKKICVADASCKSINWLSDWRNLQSGIRALFAWCATSKSTYADAGSTTANVHCRFYEFHRPPSMPW